MATSGFNVFNTPSIAAALGLTPGADMLYVPSQRRGIGGSVQDLVEGPDERYQGFLDFGVAEAINITSSSADDTEAGAGCQVIFVQGLDANGAVQSKAYPMAGIGGVVTDEVWSRVWRMRSIRVQSGNQLVPNIGDISARSAVSGNPLMSYMTEGIGSTLGSNFSMPAGHTGVAILASTSTNNGQVAEVHMRGALISENNDFPFNTGVTLSADQGTGQQPILFSIPPLTDIIIDAVSAGGNTDVFASYTVYVTTQAAIGNPNDAPIFGGN